MKSVAESWQRPPERLTCDRWAVHAWRAALDVPPSLVESLARALSPAEVERAARFWFPRDRERYIVARGILRSILGRYLDVRPDEIAFGYTAYGKPVVEGEAGLDRLRFSVSHSEGLALYAVARGREVGIDVERLGRYPGSQRIAERSFSRREVAALRQLPPEMYAEGFLACWTRMEAYLKARGVGIRGMPPDGLEPASGWTVQDLSPGPGYVGALAGEGDGWGLICWEWPRSPGAAARPSAARDGHAEEMTAHVVRDSRRSMPRSIPLGA